jgi:arylsulfatase
VVAVACVAALAASALAACGHTDRVDLAAQLPEARVWHETTRIDFGTPAARPHLLLGWGRDETWGDISIVWGVGRRSQLEFYVSTPRPIILTLQCAPFPASGGPPQRIEFAVNGTRLGEFELLPDLRVYRVPIAAPALRSGVNTLELRYAYARRASTLDPTAADPRLLAVAWSLLTLDGLADGPAPRATIGVEGSTLTLPSGSEVDFFVDVPEGAILRFDGVASLGGGAASPLLVSLERDGQPARQLTVGVHAAAAPWQQSLDGSGPVRLRLRASGAADAGTGVVLTAPHLLLPRRPAPRCPASARPPASPATPVIVYLIDTLRADRLGCYGYDRPTSPHLDAFAADAVRFTTAVAQASWTRPAVASLMTGLTPPRHGAMGGHSMLPTVPTLAAELAARGYDTAGFITNSVVAATYGFDQGFATYELLPEEEIPRPPGLPPWGVRHQSAAVLNDTAMRWLDQRRDARPPFLYLHASEPHAPYLPPPPFRAAFAPDAELTLGLQALLTDVVQGRRVLSADERRQVMALYDGEVAAVDDAFGGLMAELRARGLYDSALIIVIADHGEGFGEHGYYTHANSLYAELLHVPLLIKFPRQWRRGTVVTAPAQQIDILPTIVDTLGLDAPADIDGTSLLPALDCPDAPRPPAFSKVGEPSSFESLVAGRYKVIRSAAPEHGHGWLELYDVVADPQDRHDLAAQQPARAGALAAGLAAFRDAPAAAPARTVVPDGALQERMRALGYGQ